MKKVKRLDTKGIVELDSNVNYISKIFDVITIISMHINYFNLTVVDGISYV